MKMKAPTIKRDTVLLRIPPQLKADLERKAAENGVSLNALITLLLQDRIK